MLCTECDGKTKVIDTRRNEFEVYRHRECTVCGHKFYTIEEELDEDRLSKLRYVWANLKQAERRKAKIYKSIIGKEEHKELHFLKPCR